MAITVTGTEVAAASLLHHTHTHTPVVHWFVENKLDFYDVHKVNFISF